MLNDEHGGKRPRFVSFTSCGRRAWESYTRRLADEMNAEGFSEVLHGPWGKHRGYGARLALIVHCLRIVAGEVNDEAVDGESVRRADRLIAYFQSHARKVYATVDADPRIADARRILKWLANSVNFANFANASREVSQRDIHRQVLGSRRTVEDAEAVISILVKHGYLRTMPTEDRSGPGRRPGPRYEIHPGVFTADSSLRNGSQNSRNSQNREPGEEG
jgi:hypothetical protein